MIMRQVNDFLISVRTFNERLAPGEIGWEIFSHQGGGIFVCHYEGKYGLRHWTGSPWRSGDSLCLDQLHLAIKKGRGDIGDTGRHHVSAVELHWQKD